jgi:uncharacterized protein YkwD
VIDTINQRRSENGCTVTVVYDARLAEAARTHSLDVALNFSDDLSHVGSDGSRFSDRARAAGYTGQPRYEVIAAGRAEAERAVQQWMESTQGHREAILDCSANQIGVGVAVREGTRYSYYWVAVLGTQ